MREGIRYDWIIAVSNSAESGIKILKKLAVAFS